MSKRKEQANKAQELNAAWKASALGTDTAADGHHYEIGASQSITGGPFMRHYARNMKPLDFMVYAMLRTWYPSPQISQKTIAERVGRSERAVRDALARIENHHGLIKTRHHYGKSYQANSYDLLDINDPEVFDEFMASKGKTGEKLPVLVGGQDEKTGENLSEDRKKLAPRPEESCAKTGEKLPTNTVVNTQKIREVIHNPEQCNSGSVSKDSEPVSMPVGLWPTAVGPVLALSFEQLGLTPDCLDQLPDDLAEAYAEADRRHVNEAMPNEARGAINAMVNAQRIVLANRMNSQYLDDLNRIGLADEFRQWRDRQPDTKPVIDDKRFAAVDARWPFVAQVARERHEDARYNDLLLRLTFLSERQEKASTGRPGARESMPA